MREKAMLEVARRTPSGSDGGDREEDADDPAGGVDDPVPKAASPASRLPATPLARIGQATETVL